MSMKKPDAEDRWGSDTVSSAHAIPFACAAVMTIRLL